MGDSSPSQWSSTAASNGTVGGGVNIAENCPMSSLNNGERAIMAGVAGALTFIGTSGTDTYTATMAPAIDALVSGFFYAINFAAANTSTTPTLNLNTIGAETITDGAGNALLAGALNGPHILQYDGTNFRVLNPIPSAWSTGDVKTTLKTTADTGWVMMNDGTIGDGSSGGSTRANADTSALFTLLWNNTTNANCPVSTGRGVSAAADFAAHKTITLPKMLGRALASAGAGSGLTSRALAATVGEETHTLSTSEVPDTPAFISAVASGPSVGGLAVGSTMYNETAGFGGGAHNNMQPTSFLNFMIKL